MLPVVHASRALLVVALGNLADPVRRIAGHPPPTRSPSTPGPRARGSATSCVHVVPWPPGNVAPARQQADGVGDECVVPCPHSTITDHYLISQASELALPHRMGLYGRTSSHGVVTHKEPPSHRVARNSAQIAAVGLYPGEERPFHESTVLAIHHEEVNSLDAHVMNQSQFISLTSYVAATSRSGQLSARRIRLGAGHASPAHVHFARHSIREVLLVA